MKGYIAHAQQIVVLSKDRPFPWSVSAEEYVVLISTRALTRVPTAQVPATTRAVTGGERAAGRGREGGIREGATTKSTRRNACTCMSWHF